VLGFILLLKSHVSVRFIYYAIFNDCILFAIGLFAMFALCYWQYSVQCIHKLLHGVNNSRALALTSCYNIWHIFGMQSFLGQKQN
jgi:hypothetical protein